MSPRVACLAALLLIIRPFYLAHQLVFSLQQRWIAPVTLFFVLCFQFNLIASDLSFHIQVFIRKLGICLVHLLLAVPLPQL